MLTVPINEYELLSIEIIRIALSEPTPELREKAIANAKHEAVTFWLTTRNDKLGIDWMSDPKSDEFVRWIAKTSIERHEASDQFMQTGIRYEKGNERKLNVAEHIGKLIWGSIQDKKFEGLHTTHGILQQVSDQAQKHSVSGAKDMDTLRGIWKRYRGIVHLGMALDYCEDYPDHDQKVLDLAENFRRGLSQFCPKGTKKPYVAEGEQIIFRYISIF
jgi:hypothetical protein